MLLLVIFVLSIITTDVLGYGGGNLIFIISVANPMNMYDIFLGFNGIWKGDGVMIIKDLRAMYHQ